MVAVNMGQETEVSASPAKIEVFGFDVSEISQIRRIRAIADLGHDVHSFTMRRENMNSDFEPDWPNTHLFMTQNENLPKRAMIVAASILKMTGHRERLRAADMIFARNLDMLAIAWAARALAGVGSGPNQVPLVYECLDINGALCRDDAKSRAMRGAERRLLSDIQMLVVSSPGFIRNYFEPFQSYDGPWALWENKLAAGKALPERPNVERKTVRKPDDPLRIGWVGTIRCAPSLEILAALAERMGQAIEIHIHGVLHQHAVPNFYAIVGQHKNIIFHGAYDYPDDLATIYDGMDLVWSQDLWQSGNNSEWLLPNRIYEASWAGCPSLAVAGTETGRRVHDDALGWVIDKPEVELLYDLLTNLPRSEIAARRGALLARPASDFVQSSDEIADVIQQVRRGQS